MKTEIVLPEINNRKCHECGKCVDICKNLVFAVTPAKRVLFRSKQKVLVVNPQNCVGCNACVVSCPHHAISLWKLPVPEQVQTTENVNLAIS